MVEKKSENLIARPPVVVILGHVDHGKSSLIEKVKEIKILEKEAGGITQHIGAYEIEHKGQKITFIDTPGHEAFSAIRSRGSKVADIAILVVDAAEGTKIQTKEAISHVKMAQIPMIIALNKMDLPGANPERVKRELERENVKVESLGGRVPAVEISAKTGQGIPELLELTSLVAEMEDLKADIEKSAEGVVIESYLDSKRGPTATLLVRNGILKKNEILATSSACGVVRILEDFQEKPLEKALPSQSVIVVGFERTPRVGEKFMVYPSLQEAQKGIEPGRTKEPGRVIAINEGKKVLNLILKADVLGSLEAIGGVLEKLPQEKVVLRLLEKGVGEISEGDIKLAKGGRAKVLGFRVKPDAVAKKLAERDGITIITFDVIYELVQAVRTLMEKRVTPEIVRKDLGKLKILVLFKRDKDRQVVGGKMLEGEITKGTMIEVFRGKEKIGQGKLVNLQKNKKDIKRGVKGDEMGILYEGKGLIEEDDILVIYKEEKKKAEL